MWRIWRFFVKNKENESAVASSSFQQATLDLNLTSKICSCHAQKSQINGIQSINERDTTRQLVSLCILGIGLSLLFKFFYSEYRAFITMRSALCKIDSKGKIHRRVSLEDFIKYR